MADGLPCQRATAILRRAPDPDVPGGHGRCPIDRMTTAEPGHPLRDPAGAPPHVLLVEAPSHQRDRLAAVLTGFGYAVTEVASGEAALTAYVCTSPPLVLLDVDLDGIGGVEVCRRIRGLDPARATAMLVYSRGGNVQAILAALEAGADDYMLVPGSAEHMRARLMLAERRLLQETARRAAESDAVRARYMAGVGEMAIALQHEINNPLAAILAHAELMAMDAAEAGRTDESIETIVEQARRIADVVRRLTSLRNPTSVEYVPGKRMVHLHEEG